MHCLLDGQVSEQMDSLRVLATDPVDYLVTPRVLASMVAGPILNVLCFCMGEKQRMLMLGSLYTLVPVSVAPPVACGADARICGCCGAGMAASVFLADLVYNVPANVIIDSARRALTDYDVLTSMVKSWVFGSIVATVRCAVCSQTQSTISCYKSVLIVTKKWRAQWPPAHQQLLPWFATWLATDLLCLGVHHYWGSQGRRRGHHQRCGHLFSRHLHCRLCPLVPILCEFLDWLKQALNNWKPHDAIMFLDVRDTFA